MNLAVICHVKSKYVGFLVLPQANGYDVFRKNGEHMVCVRDGQDLSEQLGCAHRHCLSPIPKDARLFKVKDGKIVQDELFEQRLEARKKYVSEDGHVPSCEEIAAVKAGLDFRSPDKKVQAQVRAELARTFDSKQVEYEKPAA